MVKWTAEEDAILISERKNKKSLEEISKILNKTVRQIKYRVAYLGIQEYGWTSEENELLRKMRKDNRTYREIGLVFNMKPKSVAAHCYALGLDRKYSILDPDQLNEVEQLLDFGLGDEEISRGLSISINKIRDRRIARNKSRFWTKQEEEKLKGYVANKLTNNEIAKELNRSLSSIRAKMAVLKLLPHRNWTTEEVDILRNLVEANCPYTTIAKHLKRTFKSVYKKVTRLKWSNKKIVKDSDSNELRPEDCIKKLWSAKDRAKKRDFAFDIDEEAIKFAWEKQKGKCFYTKLPMHPSSGGNYGWSIDRIDSEKGYTKDNVVLCLWMLNKMKFDLSLYDFIETCKLVVARFEENPLTSND